MTSAIVARKLRFGIIGAGSIADYHVNGLRAAGSVDIEAITARSPESARRAAARFGIRKGVADWPALLAGPGLDAVVIATPDDTHREIACAALAAGLHVLLQKPMALTVPDCQEIAHAARTSQRMLSVSFMHRYFPEVAETRRLLSDPAQPLGAVLSARLRNATPGADWSDWFYSRARARGGVVLQLGVHGIDLLQHLFGSVGRISAQTALRRKTRQLRDGRTVHPDVEDHAFATYTMTSGMLVSHEMCYAEITGTDRFALEIVCENAVVHLRGPRGPLAIRMAGVEEWQTPALPTLPLGMQQHRDFVAMLRGELPPDGTPEQALAGMRVVDAIYESAETGAAVNLDEAETAALARRP